MGSFGELLRSCKILNLLRSFKILNLIKSYGILAKTIGIFDNFMLHNFHLFD